MDSYSWDAGVAIGYFIWDGQENKAITDRIDQLAINCYRFVNNRSLSCKNYVPANSYSEIENKLGVFRSTFLAIIQHLTAGRFSLSPSIDMAKFTSLTTKLKDVDKKTAIKVLTRLESMILTKWDRLKSTCKLLKYHSRIEAKHEKTMEPKFRKRGDMLNYSSTIHLHNKVCECTFITTDKTDFGSLSLDSLGLPYKMPPIEFVQNY